MTKIYKKRFDEMSKPLKWVVEKIRSLEPEINRHLLKILLFEKQSTWKRDVSDWLTDISTYTTKPNDNYLKVGQYFQYLFNEPFEKGEKEDYKKTTIYKYCSQILNNSKYNNLKCKYRIEKIPVKEWKELLKYFYIEVDDYLSKGIFDASTGNYLIETFIIGK